MSLDPGEVSMAKALIVGESPARRPIAVDREAKSVQVRDQAAPAGLRGGQVRRHGQAGAPERVF